MKYAIVIEKAGSNYSGWVLDLPGCIATGPTPEMVEKRLGEAIALHIEGMVDDGMSVPPPSSDVRYIDIGA